VFLQAAKGFTGIGVTVIIRPPQYHLIHLSNKFMGHDWCPPFGERLDPTNIALRCFARKYIDVGLACVRTRTFHELEADKIKAFSDFRDTGLFPIDR